MIVHFADQYLIAPPHKITVELVGLGGTGSQVMNNLARMNHALMSLGHPGLHVRAWDDDIVSPANIGRQLFSGADLGLNKAVVSITRVNRYFGYDWEACPEAYTGQKFGNFIISCVDSATARLMLDARLEKPGKGVAVDKPIYWLDIGNLQKTGQCVLGTIQSVQQPKKQEYKTRHSLPDVVKLFPQLKTVKEEKQGPSCSLAEALTKQDLFINSTLAQFGCGLIWKLFREGMIRHHGCYVNLDSCIVNPIKIK